MGAAAPRLTGAGRWLLDAILPPRCLGCGCVLEGEGGLCSACWPGVSFLAAPWCALCGHPFPYAMGDGALCGACTAAAPPYRARAVMAYDDGARPLVLGFKHGDRTHAATVFGAWLARAGREFATEADLLVPVPLHPWRLFLRRYNQAALLAWALGQAWQCPVVPDVLARRRATPSQGGLSRQGRFRNVEGAFQVRERRVAAVRDARIVLVDDVMTTGATAAACARALLQAGAARVDVVTLARVVLPL